jgi:hypothetical protein
MRANIATVLLADFILRIFTQQIIANKFLFDPLPPPRPKNIISYN